jgi:tyrosyl-tRNA synthetase
MGVYEELVGRGLIAQTSGEEKIKDMLNNGRVVFYIGFDPTADSLHVGHFVTVILMSHLQKAGHLPIALFGGGTGMIGDPSGKTDMRRMLTREEIAHNIECFKTQMSRLVDFSEGKALMENNANWLLNLNYVDFLREIGVHFSVNRMLAAECYKQRLERGLSFFELNYMIMQGYDFLVLNRKHGCTLQVGGDDQWSNILAGTELIRRCEGKEAYALTITLLTNSEGKKMGKTEKGAVWLDKNKTSPFEFYQYWRNVGDKDVIRCLKILTFVPLERIAALEKLEGSALNDAKELLAFEVTRLIHGDEEAGKAQDAAKALFVRGGLTENMPTTLMTDDDFTSGFITILELLVRTGLAPSKADARRLVSQGGITVNGKKAELRFKALPVDFQADGMIIKKGKKTYHKVKY